MAWNKELDKALAKKLIGRSHPLKPAVVVGHAGLSDAVIEQVKRILQTHDLIKVRIELDEPRRGPGRGRAGCPEERGGPGQPDRQGRGAVQAAGGEAGRGQPAPKRPAKRRANGSHGPRSTEDLPGVAASESHATDPGHSHPQANHGPRAAEGPWQAPPNKPRTGAARTAEERTDGRAQPQEHIPCGSQGMRRCRDDSRAAASSLECDVP